MIRAGQPRDAPGYTQRFAFGVGRRGRASPIRDVAKDLRLDCKPLMNERGVMMNQHSKAVLGLLLFPFTVLMMPGGAAHAQATQADDDKLIAIDVLLEPDQTMIGKSRAVNARLRENFPAGYELDAAHAPHITLLQRFVRAKDFDAVTAALAKVLVAERPTEMPLKAKSYDYVMWGGHAVTVFIVERTPELMRLHQKAIDAVAPFSVNGGTAAAFVGTEINPETIGWVETFIPKSSGEKYVPHVTVGVANEDFAQRMKAEPYEAFTFKADGVAIYQLGNFGTAAKMLWQNHGK